MPIQNQLMLKALEAIKENDHLKAAELLERVLQDDPNHDEAWVMAAKLFKDPAKRLEYAQKALEVDPTNREAEWMIKTLPSEVSTTNRRRSIIKFFDSFFILALSLTIMVFLLWFGGVLQARPQPILERDPFTPIGKTIPHKITSGDVVRVSPLTADPNETALPAISDNNQFIAFNTYTSRIFYYDLQQSRSTAVTARPDEGRTNGVSSNASISADGQFIVYESSSRNLNIVGYPDGIEEEKEIKNVFLFDRLTSETHLISKTIDNQPINESRAGPLAPVISSDGAYIVYQSVSPDIVPNDTNNRTDIFLYDRAKDETTRISVSSDGVESNGSSFHPDISADGHYIVFSSLANNLDNGTPSGIRQIFLHNRKTKVTKLIKAEDEKADYPVVSADGLTVAYLKLNSNVNEESDEIGSPIEIIMWTRDRGRVPIGSDILNELEDFDLGSLEDTHLSMSPNGRFIVFGQSTKYLKRKHPNTKIRDAFVYDRETEKMHQFKSEGQYSVDDGLYDPSITADGKWLVFVTQDDELTFVYQGLTILMTPTKFELIE